MASDRATLQAKPRTEFGSRTSRRLRREGLVPGVVYGGGAEARAFQVGEREAQSVISAGRRPDRPRVRRRRGDPGRRQGAAAPSRARPPPCTSTCSRCDSTRRSRPRSRSSSLGAEDAPGVKEGGVLEHVTHQVTIEALPTEIPDSIAADVSGDGDRRHAPAQRRECSRGRQVRLADETRRGDDRHTLSAAGRGGARARGRGGGGAGRRGGRGGRGRGGPGRGRPERPKATRATRTGSRALSLFAGAPGRARLGRSGRRPDPGRRARQSGQALRSAPATTSASRSPRELARRWELPRPRERFGGLIAEGRAGPGGPQGRDAAAADLHERVGHVGRPRPGGS